MIAIASLKDLDSITIYKVVKAFLYCFCGLIALCLLIALPYDLALSRRDKQMCKRIKIDYNEMFLSLAPKQKQTIRKRFKKLAQSHDESTIDWLNFEEKDGT
ncbi:hypothetical protein [Alteromonas aestuariivivens]|uniref:hypothetical protein n=1 Tax=Alteromonas aestuariivivens TaxID=1938339 RepID=UPI0011C08166|nr:hypothetical protein [Alteromonas aestuariivivens]